MLKIIKTTETQLVELKPENIESGAWISLIRPTADELNEVEDITGAPQDFVRSALDPEESSRIEIEDNHILVLINVPVNHDSNISEYDTLPLGIIITPDYFVTVCQEHNDVIQNFSESRFRYFNTWKRTRFLFQILYRSAMLFLKDLRQMTRRSDQIEQVVVADILFLIGQFEEFFVDLVQLLVFELVSEQFEPMVQGRTSATGRQGDSSSPTSTGSMIS